MRKSSAKLIRKVAGHIGQNSITRRVYRRLKKEYSRMNKREKTAFNDGAKEFLKSEKSTSQI